MEYIDFAFTGINILPSILLLMVVFYWLSIIAGIFSFDIVDFDFDLDLDYSSNVYFDGGIKSNEKQKNKDFIVYYFFKLIKFLNIGEIPIMIYGTIFFIFLWVLSMLVYYTNISPRSLWGFLIFIQNIIITFFITKGLTEPFKNFFAAMEDSGSIEIVGKRCITKSLLKTDNIGQAEITINGYPIVINVKSLGGTIIKGSQVVVVSKVKDKELYIVKEKIHN